MPALELRIRSYRGRRFSPNQRPEDKAVCGPSAPVSPGTSPFPTAWYQAEAEEMLKCTHSGQEAQGPTQESPSGTWVFSSPPLDSTLETSPTCAAEQAAEEVQDTKRDPALHMSWRTQGKGSIRWTSVHHDQSYLRGLGKCRKDDSLCSGVRGHHQKPKHGRITPHVHVFALIRNCELK